jgi:CRP/FNR family transcriptional regulator
MIRIRQRVKGARERVMAGEKKKTEVRALGECQYCGEYFCMKKLPLFQEIPAEILYRLAGSASREVYHRGSLLFSEGDEISSIYIIKEGRVKLCRYHSDGKEYILDILKTGNSIWESLFLHDPVYPYSAVCLNDVSVCRIRKKDFMEILSDDREVLFYLISVLSQRLQDAKEHALLLSIHDAEVRLAGFLLDRQRRWSENEIHMRLEDIASSVNLRVETVSRILRRFEKDGIVVRPGQGKIIVLDFDRLRRVFAEKGKL